MHLMHIQNVYGLLTKYVVGAKANPPKNPRSSLKKGSVMATNIVKPEIKRLVEYTHICRVAKMT